MKIHRTVASAEMTVKTPPLLRVFVLRGISMVLAVLPLFVIATKVYAIPMVQVYEELATCNQVAANASCYCYLKTISTNTETTIYEVRKKCDNSAIMQKYEFFMIPGDFIRQVAPGNWSSCRQCYTCSPGESCPSDPVLCGSGTYYQANIWKKNTYCDGHTELVFWGTADSATNVTCGPYMINVFGCSTSDTEFGTYTVNRCDGNPDPCCPNPNDPCCRLGGPRVGQ